LHNNLRIEWIQDDFQVCKKKLEEIEEKMRVLLGDPFAEEEN
jgi:tetrahydromethanopterin S-methyltransferase subunit G